MNPQPAGGEDRSGRGEPAWSGPSPRLAVLRHVEVAAASALTVAVALAITLPLGEMEAAVVASLAVVAGGAVVDVFVGRRVRSWGYTEQSEDLLVRRGVMFRRLSVIPYGRMQFVDVTAGPFERAFGLATVQMHTAAAASDARIPGLPAEEAGRLRDQLSQLGESQAAGL